MLEIKICKPRCQNCKSLLCYYERVPKKVKGAFLKYGYRYCTGDNRIREFKPRDPKIYVPCWCPLKKTPAELRVYCFKDEQSRWMHMLLQSHGIQESPGGYQYAVRYSDHTSLSASELLELSQEKTLPEILGIPIHIDEIVEIDDGLNPYYFQLIEHSVIKTIRFDGERACQNKLEVV